MDTLANMLNTIKTGGFARKDSVEVPFSNYKAAVAKALLDAGYIAGYEKASRTKGGDKLVISLAYGPKGEAKVQHIKRISKPSRRLYAGAKDLRPVKSGFGKVFLSTPKGVVCNETARKEHVGGELLFEIW